MSYPERLDGELGAVGIRGALARRILAEIADHLACDPQADLGDPAALARQFADELGTRRALRAALSAFAALVVAGALFLAAVSAVRSAGDFAVLIHHHQPVLGNVGLALSALGAQLAFVAGSLGCLRALRRRHAGVLSREEALVLVRRAAVGILGGLLTFAGLAMTAIVLNGHIASWWTTLALSVAGAGALVLIAALPTVLAARRLPPHLGGAAGDLGDDLRGVLPPQLDAGRWGFALLVAGAVAFVIALAGVVQADPYDGLLRGLADGAACIVGYATLGRYLGLRSTGSTAEPS